MKYVQKEEEGEKDRWEGNRLHHASVSVRSDNQARGGKPRCAPVGGGGRLQL